MNNRQQQQSRNNEFSPIKASWSESVLWVWIIFLCRLAETRPEQIELHLYQRQHVCLWLFVFKGVLSLCFFCSQSWAACRAAASVLIQCVSWRRFCQRTYCVNTTSGRQRRPWLPPVPMNSSGKCLCIYSCFTQLLTDDSAQEKDESRLYIYICVLHPRDLHQALSFIHRPHLNFWCCSTSTMFFFVCVCPECVLLCAVLSVSYIYFIM